ncbi:CAP domain-containing protein [Amorphus orientalis]|uniref:Uncharacterized protein YkwD n=1 Tax=Amorphus orientalis TaxID=649198 RepID=A0AAE3VQ56_9HYPH|nr:CAP domain-containing protein [Amorphus orientalis]MDQ0316057.1 uncharacterized protein YkwD [Amorphus orientalis]
MVHTPIRIRARKTARFACAAGLALLVAACGSFDIAGGSNLPALRQQSLALVNDARAREGLPPLTLDPALNRAAQAHANDMRRRNYYAHTSLLGLGPPERYAKAGGSPLGHFAENIARCFRCAVPADAASVRQLHEQWMNSPSHRAHILKPEVTRYGFGLAETENGKHYAVEDFYGPVRPEDYRRAPGL